MMVPLKSKGPAFLTIAMDWNCRLKTLPRNCDIVTETIHRRRHIVNMNVVRHYIYYIYTDDLWLREVTLISTHH